MQKILIANRGEIALRVMRSAREMGIKTVAVYSDADRDALHVRYADEAIHIGESPSVKSYLDGEKIIAACKKTGAEAIHPGYGFLSENPAFAKKVSDAGLILIGPSPRAMEIMGNKLSAKAAALKYNIPMVPGTEEAITDVNDAKKRAQRARKIDQTAIKKMIRTSQARSFLACVRASPSARKRPRNGTALAG